MRQAPTYGIIGNGRLAKHFIYYLSLLDIPTLQWSRSQDPEILNVLISQSHVILLLISDSAVESFIENHSGLSQHSNLIHCSGALVTPLAKSVHPLMTFGPGLYSLEEYQKIPFIVSASYPSLNSLLPGLSNPFYRLADEQRALYHALCVMANNFTTILWQKVFASFENELNIPAQALHPLLEKTVQNLEQDYQNALTGPLIRRDQKTIEKNLAALSQDPFHKIYETFVDVYCQEKK